MNEKYNGGPAFPVPDQKHDGGLDGYYGMSLRDYFAAKALLGVMQMVALGMHDLCRIGTPRPEPADELAREAYRLADAMLKARAV